MPKIIIVRVKVRMTRKVWNVPFSSPFLWLTSALASLGDFGLNGVWTPGREISEISKFNGYSLVNALAKGWSSRGAGSKSCQVYQMLLQLTKFWGFDLEVVLLLWNGWLPKMDKILEVGAGSLDNYSTVEKWFRLVQAVTVTSASSLEQGRRPLTMTSLDLDNFVGRDPFLSFLKLLLAHAVLTQEGSGSRTTSRDWKRLKSHLAMNLNKNSVGNWGEIGLLRVSTMYLALAWATAGQESVSMCDRLKEILAYGKPSPARVKTVLRASCTGIFILLQKSLDISTSSLTSQLMSFVTNLLSQSPLDSGRKDNVMIYLELLESLPKTPGFTRAEEDTSGSGLGRETLISPNLTMWLSSCGPNYVVRTLRTLYALSNWIITSKSGGVSSKCPERDGMASRIFERTTGFLSGAVILNANRVPHTDVEPMANLAADLTLFSKWSGSASSGPESVGRLFDHFALNERTCPEVSQFYVGRILASGPHQEALFGSGGSGTASSIPFVKWCQVWIRLAALDVSIPEGLTELVLGAGYSSTSNVSLLERLCLVTSREWSRNDVQTTLTPLTTLLKGVMTSGGLFKETGASRSVSGIIRSSTQILEQMEWSKVYVKNDPTSVGLLLMHSLIPPIVGTPSWERLPKHVLSALKPNLFHIFKAITSSSGFDSDQFLKRKLQDLINFSLLAYVTPTPEELDDEESSPASRIMIYSEDHDISFVLSTAIPALSALMGNSADVKLNVRFVQGVVALKNAKLATTVRRFLPGILSIYVKLTPFSEPGTGNGCLGVVTYCCAFGLTPLHRDAIVASFDSVMESSFAFKSRRWWELAGTLAKCSRVQVKKFLKIDLLPLFRAHVAASEQRRETGMDMSLRNPLEKLERDVAAF